MAKCLSCNELVTSRPFPFVLQILALLGAFATGSYSLWCLIARQFGGINGIRMVVALIYLIIFSTVIPSAELGLMQHPHLVKFGRFILSPIGRAFLYIFMGGVLLGHGVGGWVVGIYMLGLGVLNIVASCILKEL